jgi:glutamate racemase
LEFFRNFDIEMLIVACNSVSAYALNELKESSKIPIYGVINAGVEACKSRIDDKNARILILGTKATIKSNRYQSLLNSDGYTNINSISPSLFVPLVEEGIVDEELTDRVMEHYFKDIQSPDAIILGCTHYPFLKKRLQSYFPDAKLIHSGDAIIELLKHEYDFKESYKSCKIDFFASDNPTSLRQKAKEWLSVSF